MMAEQSRAQAPILRLVADDLCCGCGMCAGVCPRADLTMVWTPRGERVPAARGDCPASCGICAKVCPFADAEPGLDALCANLFASTAKSHRAETGYSRFSHVGHVTAGDYRARGASGGLTTWLLAEALQTGLVDRVICVRPNPDPELLFRFDVVSRPEEVRESAQSAYYPVDMAEAIRQCLAEDGRYAVVALPCAAEALRRACALLPKLAERIVLVLGLVCGQMKSRGFTDYLVRASGLAPREVTRVRYRCKVADGTANDFEFHAMTPEGTRILPRRSSAYNTTWMTGQFKLRACDFCDDAFAEAADAALMDAWAPAYAKDPLGTSIVLTRSAQVEELIDGGTQRSELSLAPYSIERVIEGQSGVLIPKRRLLSNRLWLAHGSGDRVPRKRVGMCRPGSFTARKLAALERLRQVSHEAMVAQREADPLGLEVYDKLVAPHLQLVRRIQRTERRLRPLRAVMRRVGKLIRRPR